MKLSRVNTTTNCLPKNTFLRLATLGKDGLGSDEQLFCQQFRTAPVHCADCLTAVTADCVCRWHHSCHLFALSSVYFSIDSQARLCSSGFFLTDASGGGPIRRKNTERFVSRQQIFPPRLISPEWSHLDREAKVGLHAQLTCHMWHTLIPKHDPHFLPQLLQGTPWHCNLSTGDSGKVAPWRPSALRSVKVPPLFASHPCAYFWATFSPLDMAGKVINTYDLNYKHQPV